MHHLNLRMKTILVAVVLTLVTLASAKRGKRCMFLGDAGENVVDLSYTLSNETYLYPTDGAPFKLTFIDTSQLSIYVRMNRMETAEHIGTHIDSISHFKKGGLAVDELPLKNLMGRGVMIDITVDGEPREENYEITIDDVLKWEAKHGKICCGKEIIFFRTGLGRYFETDLARYLGTNDPKNSFDFNFPGIGSNLAKFLVEKRRVRVVGTDTVSTDMGNSQVFEAHQILLNADVVLLENLANLDQLVDSVANFHVLIMPMKIKDGTASPTRVLAIKDDKDQ